MRGLTTTDNGQRTTAGPGRPKKISENLSKKNWTSGTAMRGDSLITTGDNGQWPARGDRKRFPQNLSKKNWTGGTARGFFDHRLAGSSSTGCPPRGELTDQGPPAGECMFGWLPPCPLVTRRAGVSQINDPGWGHQPPLVVATHLLHAGRAYPRLTTRGWVTSLRW